MPITRIKNLINAQTNSVTAAAFLVAASSLLSRLLGIFRDRILAGEFGAGDTLDIYYAAFRIPDLIFNLLVLGALSAGFIPIFTNLLKSDKAGGTNDDAWRFSNLVISALGLGLIIISALAMFFTKQLMVVIAPGFGAEKQTLTIELTRIMFLSPFFLGISSILGGMLQSFKRFFIYSLAPIMYNLGIIIGALYFVPVWGVAGLAWGVVLGAAVHMLIQLPAVIQLGFRLQPNFNLKNLHLRRLGRLMVPRTMSLAIAQIDLSVATMIATTLMAGSLAIFNFANNLQSFAVGVFGISFAVAVFPTLAANVGNSKKFIEHFSSTFRQILFFIVPMTVLFLVLRAQIVRVVLGTGQFNWEDTVLTIRTLGFFTISLFAQATIPLLTRMFYARDNSRTPFYIGMVSVAVDIMLALWLSKTMGVAGLALAFSAANIVNFILLWLVLRFDLGGLDESKIVISVAKFSAAGLAAGLVAQQMKAVVWPFIDMTRLWGVFAQGAVAGLLGLVAYFIICVLLKSEEFYNFFNSLRRRLPFVKAKAEDHLEARGI